MNAPLRTPRLAPAIAATLGSLRARIHRYIWTEGVLLAIAWLGVAFWISFAADRVPVLFAYDDPELWVRVTMLCFIGVVLSGILYWTIFRRVFVAMSDRSMAILIERRFREFDDSLLTTVEMEEQPDHAAAFNPEMLEFTSQEALRHTGDVVLADVFNPGPRIRNAIFAVIAVASVVTFAFAKPGAMETWFQRCILLRSDVVWPRYNHIEVDGPRTRKAPRGADVTIRVRSNATDFEVPDRVRIIHHYADGSGGSENMNREGAKPVRESDGKEYQYFTYKYHGLVDSVTFDVVGGDYRVRGYKIEVVDRPTITMTLDVDYPPYINRTDVTNLEISREQEEVPQGSHVVIHCEANKPLATDGGGKGNYVTLHRGDEQGAGNGEGDENQPKSVPLAVSSDGRKFSYEVRDINQITTLEFSLLDTDGITTQQPIPFVLSPIIDQAPDVQATFYGVGDAITINAKLPIRGLITDDYGIDGLRYTYRIQGGEEKEVTVPFKTQPKGLRGFSFTEDARREGRPEEALDFYQIRLDALQRQRDLESNFSLEEPIDAPAAGEEVVDVGKFQLHPGQTVVVGITATDAATVGDGPYTGAGNEHILKVVTEEELRGILAAKELNSRINLERVRDEFFRVKSSLDSMIFDLDELEKAAGAPTEDAAPGEDAEGEPKEDAKEDADAQPPAEIQDGDDPPKLTREERFEGLLTENRHRCQRALFKSEENRNEIITITEFFKSLRQEYENNRLDTDEVKDRLTGGIIQPLERLHNDEDVKDPKKKDYFDEFDDRLETLMSRLTARSDASLREQALADVKEQASLIRDTLVDILSKMEELENYNEIIRLLREILEEKNRLIRDTKEAGQTLP